MGLGENDGDGEKAVFLLDGEGTVVFFGDGGDGFKAITMFLPCFYFLFGEVAFEIILDDDEAKAHPRFDFDADETLLFFFKGGKVTESVIDRVPE